jgi:succinoglycan biosynthesis protein ExoM
MSQTQPTARDSGTEGARPEKVAVCVCTFRRPDGLRRLLTGLGALRFSRVPRPEVLIVLADNAPDASARDIVAEMQSRIPWSIRYVHEPRRGLAFARNATLDAVPGDARWVAFIDDDEEPAAAWLDALLATALAHAAAIVAGPVRPCFQSAPPAWIVAGGFFRFGPYVDGAAARVVATNNALVEAKHIRRHGWRFDLAFNHTGGEDQHFFSRAVEAGLKAVTAAEAEVVETVPPERTSLAWLLRRHFRMGTTLAKIDIMRAPTVRSVLVRFAKALGRIGLGASQLVRALPRDQSYAGVGICNIAWGLGSLAGLVGLGYQEYGPRPPVKVSAAPRH